MIRDINGLNKGLRDRKGDEKDLNTQYKLM